MGWELRIRSENNVIRTARTLQGRIRAGPQQSCSAYPHYHAYSRYLLTVRRRPVSHPVLPVLESIP